MFVRSPKILFYFLHNGNKHYVEPENQSAIKTREDFRVLDGPEIRVNIGEETIVVSVSQISAEALVKTSFWGFIYALFAIIIFSSQKDFLFPIIFSIFSYYYYRAYLIDTLAAQKFNISE